jgi:hypothetical protein
MGLVAYVFPAFPSKYIRSMLEAETSERDMDHQFPNVH